MPDREKIVKTFEECLCKGHDFCSKCYQEGPGLGFVCRNNVCLEVLNLLKEQEAKQVIKQTYHVMMNRDYENPVEVTRYDWLCPTCKSLLCRDIDVIDDNYHFCKVCGQAVKWE